MRELLFDSDDHYTSYEYTGQVFYEHVKGDPDWKLGVSYESLKHLENGPEDPECWEVWEDVEKLARFTRNGHEYRIEEDDYASVYLIPIDEPVVLIDSVAGIYAYQYLFEKINPESQHPATNLLWELNINDDDKADLTKGPEAEHYAEAATNLLDNAIGKDSNGLKYQLYGTEQGDIWRIPEGFTPED